jgi:Uncharacterized protein with conserved CXXC pairs
MIQELTCIRCPVGCLLRVTIRDEAVTEVQGQQCERGRDYAQVESVHPVRMFTTTLPIAGGTIAMLPVRTRTDIPKAAILRCAEALCGVEVAAPVQVGDVVVSNLADTGVDLIATRTVPALPPHSKTPVAAYREQPRVHRN